MKNKRQDVDSDNLKRDADEPQTTTTRRDSSRGRHREKEDIKITKERTPASEEEAPEWEATREDSDIGDYDYELSLEMKRQKIQRELMKLEQENQDKREEITIKKDETLKNRGPAVTKRTIGYLLSPRSLLLGLIEGCIYNCFIFFGCRSSKGAHSKKKGPRTPSPPPPVPLELPVSGKKHKTKHKNKEKSEEKMKEKERDGEKHKDKKDKRR
uniref:Uncharacterized protein n=1 Tax=Periophthalmus magnuspinnatus TaxID=409849 RepID=A0A3B4AGM6_9GOBI